MLSILIVYYNMPSSAVVTPCGCDAPFPVSKHADIRHTCNYNTMSHQHESSECVGPHLELMEQSQGRMSLRISLFKTSLYC